MGVGYAFQSVPTRLALVSCAIYMTVTVLLPRALILCQERSAVASCSCRAGDGRSSMQSSFWERLVWHGNL